MVPGQKVSVTPVRKLMRSSKEANGLWPSAGKLVWVLATKQMGPLWESGGPQQEAGRPPIGKLIVSGSLRDPARKLIGARAGTLMTPCEALVGP